MSVQSLQQPTNAAHGRSRIGAFLNERLGLEGLVYHVPEHANTLPYTLGGITMMGFVILVVTGIYLAQFYHPHPADAHDSVIYIITGAPLGDIVRSVHFWTAQIVTITAILHMLRVLLTGSYKRPREINWFVGLGLLGVTMLLVFTGTVLKFDQEGVEALQHNIEAAEIVGALGGWFSAEFSRSVPFVMRLFNAHVTILPLLFGGLIAAHIYLIKQHGISPKPTFNAATHPTAGTGTSHFTLHLQRMIGFGLFILALALALSLIFPAPLGQAGVAGAEVTKPWWMFVWLLPFEQWWGARALLIVPAVLAVLLALVPLLDRTPLISPVRRKPLIATAALVLLVIIALSVFAILQPVAAHLNG